MKILSLAEGVRELVSRDELHAVDRVLGRYLAALDFPNWPPGYAGAAARMVEKYALRLRTYGMRLQHDAGPNAACGGEGPNPAAQHGSNRAPEAAAMGTLSVNCTAFTLGFAYDRDMQAAVRLLPGAHFDEAEHLWRVPMTLAGAEQVLEFARLRGFGIDAQVYDKIGQLTEVAAERIASSKEQAAEYHVPGLLKALRPYQQAGSGTGWSTRRGGPLSAMRWGWGRRRRRWPLSRR